MIIGAVLLGVLLIGGIYWWGFVASQPVLRLELPELPEDLAALSDLVTRRENDLPTLRPDNEARIVWANRPYQSTPYSLLYLHGFSASQGEANPIHRDFARRYGFNLYLSRLQGHGLNRPEPLLDFTPEAYLDSALEALAISQRLGEKVIIMATSTGCTVALYLAAHFPSIVGLICYSPNVDLYSPLTPLLLRPGGLALARQINQGQYRMVKDLKENNPYWDQRYRLEAVVELKRLLAATMHRKTFRRVQQPCFIGYYEQDRTVSVSRIKQLFHQLGTPSEQKWLVHFPDAGDHCIPCPYFSGAWKSVRAQSFQFAESVMGLEVQDLHLSDAPALPKV